MKRYFVLLSLFFTVTASLADNPGKSSSFRPGDIWPDTDGKHINAHGGGIFYHQGKYYWFGEHKGERSSAAWVGVTCYSSDDLYNWKNEGIALPESKDPSSLIVEGCTIERPKVIYNNATGKFVMFFHHELKGRGYAAAYVGRAVSDTPEGPYTYLGSGRVNPGVWPENMSAAERSSTVLPADFEDWWTPEWMKEVKAGMFVREDFQHGQMSRDMTVFVDDDGKAYHIYSSEENLTLQIAELTDDYLGFSGRYIRIEPGGHNEAPAIFKKDGTYYMITSGCTGWAPNAARLLTAKSIWGPWTLHPNPCVGPDAELTFHSQSTYILPVEGKENAFIFMGDRWTPRNPIDGRYIWLPILFEDGMPVLKWVEEWDLDIFEKINPDFSEPARYDGMELVWSEEFNYNGEPDPSVWGHENGLVRNREYQWYQPDNAEVKEGVLRIYGRKERTPNPRYTPGSEDWRRKNEYAEYTSSSINTRGNKEFQYGRFEIRAKIPTASGSWPAIWTLGRDMPWPSNGEIDIMEYYQIKGVPHILANAAWGTDTPNNAKWNTYTVPFSEFTDQNPLWADEFHLWRMDWTEDLIEIYLDDRLINRTDLTETFNGSIGEHKNPFRQPHYILLNLAIGGDNGGEPDDNAFPLFYDVDYVRVYQKKN